MEYFRPGAMAARVKQLSPPMKSQEGRVHAAVGKAWEGRATLALEARVDPMVPLTGPQTAGIHDKTCLPCVSVSHY